MNNHCWQNMRLVQIFILLSISIGGMAQDIVTQRLLLSENISFTYDARKFYQVNQEELAQFNESSTINAKTKYLGAIRRKDGVRMIRVKYTPMNLSQFSSIDELHNGFSKRVPTVRIERTLDALAMTKMSSESTSVYVYVKAFKAGLLYIGVHGEEGLSEEEAVQMAHCVTIDEQYSGFPSAGSRIDWLRVFKASIGKGLSPSFKTGKE